MVERGPKEVLPKPSNSGIFHTPLTVNKMSDQDSGASAFKIRSQPVFPLEEFPRPNVATLHKLGLSRRECEVLAWVAQGKTNGKIAAELGINLGTVKKHLLHIFRKLGVQTRTAAAALALRTDSLLKDAVVTLPGKLDS